MAVKTKAAKRPVRSVAAPPAVPSNPFTLPKLPQFPNLSALGRSDSAKLATWVTQCLQAAGNALVVAMNASVSATLTKAITDLKTSDTALAAAVAAGKGSLQPSKLEDQEMAGAPTPAVDIASMLADLTLEVEADQGVEASAVTLIEGLATALTAAIAAGTAAGATPAQLASFNTLLTEVQTNSAALAAAVAANPVPASS